MRKRQRTKRPEIQPVSQFSQTASPERTAGVEQSASLQYGAGSINIAQRAMHAPHALSHNEITMLQRTVGNRSVTQRLQQSAIAPIAPTKRRVPVTAGNAISKEMQQQPAHAPSAPTLGESQRVQRGFFGDVWGGIKKGASAVGNAVGSAASAVGSGIKQGVSAIGSAASAVGSGIKQGVNAVGNAVSSVGSAIADGVKQFGKGFVNLAQRFGQGFVNMATQFGQGFVNLAAKFGKGFVDLASRFGREFVDLAGKLGQGFVRMVSKFGSIALNLAKKFGNIVVDLVNRFGKFCIDLIEKYGSIIINLIKKFGNTLINLIKDFGKIIIDLVRKYGKAFIDLVLTIGKRFIDLVLKYGKIVLKFVAYLGIQLWDKVWGIFHRVVYWFKKLPGRLGRLMHTLWSGVLSLKPWSLSWWESLSKAGTWVNFLEWLGTAVIDLLEVAGVGEMYETLMDFAKFNTRSLSGPEIRKATSVFGGSIEYNLVRVDEHALIGPSWTDREYTSFHIINGWGTMDDHTLIHELAHVWQYDHAGAIYMPQAIHAQNTREGYDYGGAAELQKRKDVGQGFLSFNREQQAQIIADLYYLKNGLPPSSQSHGATAADLPLYEHFGSAVH